MKSLIRISKRLYCSNNNGKLTANQVISTCKGTHAGPFVELPIIDYLSECSSAIIKLPASCRFYTKLGNITAITGESGNKKQPSFEANDLIIFEKMTKENKIPGVNRTFYKLQTGGNSANVILSTPSSTNIISIKLENDKTWSVLNAAENVYGYSDMININYPKGTYESLQIRNKPSVIYGFGVFFLLGNNFKILELSASSEVLVNPSKLIAFENNTGLKFTTENLRPEPNLIRELMNKNPKLASSIENIPFYKIKGPGRIIVQG
ncbi:uncharacterized protein SCODWIG_02018 [Saccharomycodes ludwigii]|uniref:Altered inheritance of mitochondria protein 24, mitochondrial n=1 Tax=Saccharomycodes ludwigii TaxID=36035 RepID=A0A376B6D2_9ASCO|nr:uncharacterized protein SCODWIG_02018 [Saccharomycodes ludwigii]